MFSDMHCVPCTLLYVLFCVLCSVFGELEMVLSGLELQHLIPLFHAHNVSFVTFLRFTDDDLDRMKIEKVSTVTTDSVHQLDEVSIEY